MKPKQNEAEGNTHQKININCIKADYIDQRPMHLT